MGKKVSKQAMAEIFGVSERTLTAWQKQGMPIQYDGKRGQRNQYDTAECIEWRFQLRLNKKLSPTHGDGQEQYFDLEKERARESKERADGLAMKNAERRRELAPIKLIEFALSTVASQIVAIFDSIPLQVKKAVPGISATAITKIQVELAKARNAAAAVKVDFSEYESE